MFSHSVAFRQLSSDSVSEILQALLASTNYGVLLTDLEHRSLACNIRFGEIWGVDIKRVVESGVDEVREMVKSRVVDLVQWESNLEQVYADPNLEYSDLIELRGPQCFVQRYSGPVVNSSGERIGRLWTFRDVTKETKGRHRFDVLHNTALLGDPDPRVVYSTLTQWVAEVFNSWSFLSIRHGDFLEFRAVGGQDNPGASMPGNVLTEAYCQFCLEADRPVLIQDARLFEGMPDILPVRLGLTRYAGVPLINSHGQSVGTLCIMDGRSEELLEEDDLRFIGLIASRISHELEREGHIQSLSQSLSTTQEQLVQSEKLAVVGTLAASVAHDIRNILATTRLKMAMAHPRPEDTLAYVGNQLDRFEVLAHRLMSYAKRSGMASEPVNLHDIALQVLELLETQANAHRVTLETEFTAEDPWVDGDAGRIEHMLVNLILNAIQAHTSPGFVRVRTSSADQGPSLEVIDDGPGIPDSLVGCIFEPFVSSRSDGFGLGLYSCREIARSHGAEVLCTSKLGDGTTFSVQFKVAR